MKWRGQRATAPYLLACFVNQNWNVVGDPTLKSIFANGADVVFKRGAEVLAVELKDISGVLNLDTLGKNSQGQYGGSISQVVRSANRLYNSSNT